MGVSVRGGLVVGGSLLRVVFMVWFCRTGPSEKSACALSGRGVMLKCYEKVDLVQKLRDTEVRSVLTGRCKTRRCLAIDSFRRKAPCWIAIGVISRSHFPQDRRDVFA